jgi:hypothetical protein
MEYHPGIHHMNSTLIPSGYNQRCSYAKTVLDIWDNVPYDGKWTWGILPASGPFWARNAAIAALRKTRIFKMSNIISSRDFAKLENVKQVELVVAAISNGRTLQMTTDQCSSPQERLACSVAMLATGKLKMPAYVASVAADGQGRAKRVVDSVNVFAAAVRSMEHIDSKAASNKTTNYVKAAKNWGVEFYKNYTLESSTGAGITAYKWVKKVPVSTVPNTPVETVPDPDTANKEKQTAKEKSALDKAEQKGLKAGLVQAESIAAESTATMAEELAKLKAQLVTATGAEYRALCAARHYAAAAKATPHQKASLTKQLANSKARAAAACKATGTVFTVPKMVDCIPATKKKASK